MSEDEPDYDMYTLADLRDAADHIDRNLYPDRAARLDRIIQVREGNRPALQIREDADGGIGIAIWVIAAIVGAALLCVLPPSICSATIR